jgi:peptidyl-prolyl cis-trans isomerase D
MLSVFRSHLNSWPARLLFVGLAVAFAAWGVGDVLRNVGDDGSLASVAGRKIELPEVQEAYRRQLAQVTKMLGGKVEPTPEIRRSVAGQALERVITQTALNAAVSRLGVVVPDTVVRQAVFDIPAFHNSAGQFDRATFEAVLNSNGMSEARFLGLMRNDLGQRALLDAVRSGVISPDILTREVFAFQQERRVADAVDLPLSAAPAPPVPDEAQLQRWYENHPDSYSTPELRRIKAVVLAPETVSKDVTVSEDELRAAYEAHREQYVQPEKRSVQVILTQDEATAKALAAKWSAGADWAAMQAEAKKDKASPVELTDATQAEFPAPELGRAVFAATPDAVPPPVKSALGWHVLKVTKVSAGGGKTFEQAKDELRTRAIADKAADLIYDRAGKVEDELAGDTKLDDLPGDLGLAAVQGTLDAHGDTPSGTPAPIPGPPELRAALLQAAFQAKPGDPPHLVQAPNAADGAQSFYAVQVEAITPPAVRPYADVAEQVREDWTHDALRHAEEQKAASLLTAVKGGQSLEAAAAAAGLKVARLPPVSRAAPAEGVPNELIQPLFALKMGEPTMVETPDGFVVAVLADVEEPNRDKDPIGYGQVRDALARAVGDDIEAVTVAALRDRGAPKVKSNAIDSIAQTDDQN